MGTVEFDDVSGKPRPIEDIKEALSAIQIEIIRGDHSKLLANGMPATMIYITISDALKELLFLRKMVDEMRRRVQERKG